MCPTQSQKRNVKVKAYWVYGDEIIQLFDIPESLANLHIWVTSILMTLIMWGTSLSQMGKKCMSSQMMKHTKTGNK